MTKIALGLEGVIFFTISHTTLGKFAFSFFKIDMAAKRRKKHKNKISWIVISMRYNEQKSDLATSGCLPARE